MYVAYKAKLVTIWPFTEKAATPWVYSKTGPPRDDLIYPPASGSPDLAIFPIPGLAVSLSDASQHCPAAYKAHWQTPFQLLMSCDVEKNRYGANEALSRHPAKLNSLAWNQTTVLCCEAVLPQCL